MSKQLKVRIIETRYGAYKAQYRSWFSWKFFSTEVSKQAGTSHRVFETYNEALDFLLTAPPKCAKAPKIKPHQDVVWFEGKVRYA